MRRSFVWTFKVTLSAISTIVGSTLSQAANAQTILFGLDAPRGALTNSRQTEADFLSELGNFGIENFDDISDGTTDPILNFGATGISAQVMQFTTVLSEFGQPTTISSPQSLQDGPSFEYFYFSQPVQAFGTFLIDLGDRATAVQLTIRLDNQVTGTTKSLVVGPFGPSVPRYGVAYFGIIDAAGFDSVEVNASFNDDLFYYDDMTIGYVAVPEPSAFAILVLGAMWGAVVRSKS